MNFCSNEQNPKEVIKRIDIINNNRYEVEYLDGSITNYITFNNYEIDEVIDDMINQSKDRDKNINYSKFKNKNIFEFIIVLFYLFDLSISFYYNLLLFFIISCLLFLNELNNYIIHRSELIELKKYKIYLEIIKTNGKDIYLADDVINITNLDDVKLSKLKSLIKY